MIENMKKILLIALLSVFLSSCGVGSYSVATGKSDKATISFVSNKKQEITVAIDNQQYDVETIKLKAYRKDRSIKKTVKNSITLAPGTHEVKVMSDGNVVYSQKIFVSTGETKIIEL